MRIAARPDRGLVLLGVRLRWGRRRQQRDRRPRRSRARSGSGSTAGHAGRDGRLRHHRVQRDPSERRRRLRAPAVGRPRGAAHHRRCRAATAPTWSSWATPRPRRSRPPAPWSTSPTTGTISGVTTWCRAWSSRGPTTASSTPCPTTPGPASSCTATDLLERPGSRCPTTMDEFVETGIALKQANAQRPELLRHLLPRAQLARRPVVHLGGRRRHRRPGRRRVGRASSTPTSRSPGSRSVQRIMTEANGAPADGDEAQDFTAFCNNEVGHADGPRLEGRPDHRSDEAARRWRPTSACSPCPAPRRGDRPRLPRWLEHRRLGQQRATPTWPATWSRS